MPGDLLVLFFEFLGELTGEVADLQQTQRNSIAIGGVAAEGFVAVAIFPVGMLDLQAALHSLIQNLIISAILIHKMTTFHLLFLLLYHFLRNVQAKSEKANHFERRCPVIRLEPGRAPYY